MMSGGSTDAAIVHPFGVAVANVACGVARARQRLPSLTSTQNVEFAPIPQGIRVRLIYLLRVLNRKPTVGYSTVKSLDNWNRRIQQISLVSVFHWRDRRVSLATGFSEGMR